MSSIEDLLNDKAREQMKNMSGANKNISELKVGEKTEGFYLVKSFEVKKTTNGKQYIDLSVVDKTGEINAKIWEYSEDKETLLADSSIVKIRGEVLEWNGSKQLKVNKIRAKVNTDSVDISELIPSAPIEQGEMFAEVKSYIPRIKDEEIRLLVGNKIFPKTVLLPCRKEKPSLVQGRAFVPYFEDAAIRREALSGLRLPKHRLCICRCNTS